MAKRITTSDFKSTDQMQMNACTDFEQAKQCGGVKPVKGVPTSPSIIGSPTAIYIKLNIIKPAQLLYHDKNTVVKMNHNINIRIIECCELTNCEISKYILYTDVA